MSLAARIFCRTSSQALLSQRAPKAMGQRMCSFGDALTIPTDKEQQSGRRKEELDAEAAGDVGFNRDPIIPASDAGTETNPIMVRVSSNGNVAAAAATAPSLTILSS